MFRSWRGPALAALATLLTTLAWQLPPAAGQGVPAWAPEAVAGRDAGSPQKAVVRYEQGFRAADAGPWKDNVWRTTAAYILGFDILEPALEEGARRDGGALDAGAAHDASSSADGGNGIPGATPVTNNTDKSDAGA
ncbi:MAG: hypothetical protein AB2A00_37370 [Myxococcota bacterium]